MKSRRKQRGWLNFVLPAVASIAGAALGKEGQEDTNESNQGINNAQMAFNAAEAAKKRDWDEYMRGSAYQATVGDLRAAGLNPMMAYKNSATPSGSGAAANAGSMIPMQNATQAGVNGAMAAAQIANVQASTKVQEKTAEKIDAEIPQTIANTGNIKQQTVNLEKGVEKMNAEIREILQSEQLKLSQGWTEAEKRLLLQAQTNVQRIEKDLKQENIPLVQAQAALNRVLKTLRDYETPGAKNTADFERSMGENVGTGGAVIKNLAQTIRLMLGK